MTRTSCLIPILLVAVSLSQIHISSSFHLSHLNNQHPQRSTRTVTGKLAKCFDRNTPNKWSPTMTAVSTKSEGVPALGTVESGECDIWTPWTEVSLAAQIREDLNHDIYRDTKPDPAPHGAAKSPRIRGVRVSTKGGGPSSSSSHIASGLTSHCGYRDHP